MPFTPAKKQVAWAKIAAYGNTGSGKTNQVSMMSIYLSKKFHSSAPVAFLDSEKGSDFVQPFFEQEGVPLLQFKTRAFTDLRAAHRDALKEGAVVLITDSLTHYWQELLKTVQGDRKRLDIKLIGEAKARWAEFTENFDRAPIHWLVAGRLGYDWQNSDIEDEDGNVKSELLRGESKIKAETDFGYESDLVLELSNADDPNAADYRRLRKGKRVIKVASAQIHTARVKKCRVRQLNGRMFSWPDKPYNTGDYAKVGSCFDPYFDFLKIGGEHVAFDETRNSSSLVDNTNKNDYYQRKKQAEIAWEEIKGALSCVWSAASGKDATTKTEVLNAMFGTHSTTAIEAMQPEKLQRGANIAIVMKNAALAKMPADRAEVLALVASATAEVDKSTAAPAGDDNQIF